MSILNPLKNEYDKSVTLEDNLKNILLIVEGQNGINKSLILYLNAINDEINKLKKK